MATSEERQRLIDAGANATLQALEGLADPEQRSLFTGWLLQARAEQLPPHKDWHSWLICAGRGFGKTRAGAEWVRLVAARDPAARIALVAGSLGEARAVLVEGESGILACHGTGTRPEYEPSLKRLTWNNGAQAFLYSAAEPESLRGPQHSHAWCDEVAKWDLSGERAMQAWDNLQMGLRLGEKPQVLATTTPRVVPLMQRLLAMEGKPGMHISRGSTFDNSEHLPLRFVAAMQDQFAQTNLGRQELFGELLTEVDGALWTRALLERCRNLAPQEEPVRIVVGVDPPASARGDECGIVVCGVGPSGMGQVLADHSLAKPTPEQWASAVANAMATWQADRVVAEANQGGDMVKAVLQAADRAMPVTLVHASRGKAARAEPVAALYEAGRVQHVGQFAQLEDQLCGLMAGGDYEGPGRSPDRADALVWALSELMLSKRSNPRISRV